MGIRSVGLNDIITFQGKSVDELEQAFKGSVDDYLNWSRECGEKPEKTFSGTFNLHIPPELHAKLAFQAKTMGISLNSYMTEHCDTLLHKESLWLNLYKLSHFKSEASTLPNSQILNAFVYTKPLKVFTNFYFLWMRKGSSSSSH